MWIATCLLLLACHDDLEGDKALYSARLATALSQQAQQNIKYPNTQETIDYWAYKINMAITDGLYQTEGYEYDTVDADRAMDIIVKRGYSVHQTYIRDKKNNKKYMKYIKISWGTEK